MAYIRKTKSEGKIAHHITEVNDIKFHSKMESDYYKHLLKLKEQGIVESFTLQPEFILQPKFFIMNGKAYTEEDTNYAEKDKERKVYNKANPDNKINVTLAIKYISDFDVLYSNGVRRIEDPKGIKTADFKLKEKMFKLKYPHLPLVCLMQYKDEWMLYEDYEKIMKENRKKRKEEGKVTTKKKPIRRRKKKK